jgi:hypothetical protein
LFATATYQKHSTICILLLSVSNICGRHLLYAALSARSPINFCSFKFPNVRLAVASLIARNECTGDEFAPIPFNIRN